MRKNGYILIILCFINTSIFSQRLIHLDSLALAKTKKMIASKTASHETLVAFKKLIRKADQLLTLKNPSVMDKTLLPPTGDKHDYLSISRYWWPDTETKDGLPWVRFDGKTNPDTQTDAVDRKRLGVMGQRVRFLSLAYYFTNNETYAQKAIGMIDTWFVNPETLMNPHLEYAQSVPGNPNKRRSGILDGRTIVMFVPDAIELLSTSEHWNANVKAKTRKWFSDYLTWLTQSDLGIKGSKQKNNHGSWYKYQVASLAFYLEDIPLVRKMVRLAQISLDDMLNDKGGQIHELERSRSFFYSCFNLQALVYIANLGNKTGVHMWQYQSENKKSLPLAINYLTPTIHGGKWNHNTLKSINLTDLIPVLSQASKHLNSQEYAVLLSKILEEKQVKPNTTLLEFWLLHARN